MRSQELVFIGEKLDHDKLKAEMDACLLDDKEWVKWQRIMKSKRSDEAKEQALLDIFQDGWEDWAEPEVRTTTALHITNQTGSDMPPPSSTAQDEDGEQQAMPVAAPKPSKAKGKAAALPAKVETRSTVKDHSGHKHSSKKQKMAAAH